MKLHKVIKLLTNSRQRWGRWRLWRLWRFWWWSSNIWLEKPIEYRFIWTEWYGTFLNWWSYFTFCYLAINNYFNENAFSVLCFLLLTLYFHQTCTNAVFELNVRSQKLFALPNELLKQHFEWIIRNTFSKRFHNFQPHVKKIVIFVHNMHISKTHSEFAISNIFHLCVWREWKTFFSNLLDINKMFQIDWNKLQ